MYLWQSHDVVMYVGNLCCVNYLIIRDIMKTSSITNIFSDSTIKQYWLLEDYSNLGPQPSYAELKTYNVM